MPVDSLIMFFSLPINFKLPLGNTSAMSPVCSQPSLRISLVLSASLKYYFIIELPAMHNSPWFLARVNPKSESSRSLILQFFIGPPMLPVSGSPGIEQHDPANVSVIP